MKNIKRKIRFDEEHKVNSPWNIAVDFTVDMSFSVKDIAGMLAEYEADHDLEMDREMIAGLIYDYTSGYPFLVSRICKLIDEKIAGSGEYPGLASAWTGRGILEAVKLLLIEKNTLFESLVHKLMDYSELKDLIYSLLFTGRVIPYNQLTESIEEAVMFGFVKEQGGNAVVSNRIFESVLYNWFLSNETLKSDIYKAALRDRNQFVENGRLNMQRTDVIVDYRGQQFVVELKVWHGGAYHERGEKQLSDYLDYYHLQKGYMLSFNFNKKKEIGINRISLNGKILVEAVV